ncbi:MAG: hypothetical protein SGI97_00535 [candidate division Zixibacteria bacterium]|nr:hypothetical protein [candidate division Zixibacteria bacterium]
MPRRKEIERHVPGKNKDCWNLYGLQVLAPNKFVSVVGKILSGQYVVVNPRTRDGAPA